MKKFLQNSGKQIYFKRTKYSKLEDWTKRAKLEVNNLDDIHFKTQDDITLKPLYNQEDISNLENEYSGMFPFTRGPYATMYTNKPWTIRQ
jgi:methylmalonyl-CoA mutase